MKYNVYEKQSRYGYIMSTDTDPLKGQEKLLNKHQKAGKGLIGLGSFFAVCGLFMLPMAFSEEYSYFIYTFLLCFGEGVLFILCGKSCLNKPKKMKEEWLAFCEEMKAKDEEFYVENPHYDEECFYKACRKNKVNINTKEGVARLQLIAKENDIEGTKEELVEKYKLGKQLVRTAEREKERLEEEERLSQLRKKEKEVENNLKKYIDLTGQDKRLRLVGDQIKALKGEYGELESAIHTAMNFPGQLNYQKESDWSILGGIASGLAGPAAGMAVAIDAQINNAAIRAQNAEIYQNATAAAGYMAYELTGRKISVEENIQKWEKTFADTKLKLVENLDQKHLLKKLNPTVVRKKITDTGACKLQVKINKSVFKIYDSVNAVVDGTFKANIIAEEKVVGTAYLTLPYQGSENEITLQTLCTEISKPDMKDFNVVFEPYNLFAIEKV